MLRRVVAGLLVLVMLGSAVMPAMASPEVTRTHVKLILRENSRTSTVVEVNGVLISLKSNENLTKANLEIKDLKTGEKYAFKYKVSENNGKYTVEVYSEGKLVNKYKSKYNPLDPTITKKLLTENRKNIASIEILSYSYWWDGVKFVKGFGIKYPHPDYTYYLIEPWDTAYIEGNQLIHYHIADAASQVIAQLAPAAAGAAIGAYVGGVVGAAVGTVLGLVLSGGTSYVLLDENGCIWFWYAKEWAEVPIPSPTPPHVSIQRLPMYFRVASYTLWDLLGVGNP